MVLAPFSSWLLGEFAIWIGGSSMEVADKDDSNGAMILLKVHDR